MSAVLVVEGLAKLYRTGFRMKKVPAVTEATFAVERGEIFGFVGPNGAGKTTTIRSILGLVRPTAGRIEIFGEPAPSRSARARLGFLPEAPYFYDYLTGREMLGLMGRLAGVAPAVLRRRTGELLERVGLAEAADRPLRKYSKGMLQRAGLAQALVADPELVILDEPMSGLDPIGRKEVRDLIVELRDAGKTVFFSTHILPDVEAICDRVAIIAGGRVHDVGPVRRLLDATILGTDVVLEIAEGATVDDLLPPNARVRRVEGEVAVTLPPEADVSTFVRATCDRGRLVSVTPRRESLEELFLRKTRPGGSS